MSAPLSPASIGRRHYRAAMRGSASRRRRAAEPRRAGPREMRLRARRAASVGVAVDEADEERATEDPEVEPDRPVLDVVEVVLHALVHPVERRRLAAPAIDLSPASDAGLDAVAVEVAIDQLGVIF